MQNEGNKLAANIAHDYKYYKAYISIYGFSRLIRSYLCRLCFPSIYCRIYQYECQNLMNLSPVVGNKFIAVRQ